MHTPEVQVGQKAPDFTLMDHLGVQRRLSDYHGHKVWLAFFRFAACPVCNLRVDEMKAWAEVFPPNKVGIQVLAVFQSTVMSTAKYVGRQAPPFPLLCDPKEEVYWEYGLGWGGSMFNANVISRGLQARARGFGMGGPREGRVNRLPGDFLIDEHGLIREKYLGADWADSIPFERVEAFLGQSRL